MTKDMRLLWLGRTLCLALALLLSGCPKSSIPPYIPICIVDGFGGGDCQIDDSDLLARCCFKNDKGYYCPPSCLKNAWATTQDGMARYSSWCSGANREDTEREMEQFKRETVR